MHRPFCWVCHAAAIICFLTVKLYGLVYKRAVLVTKISSEAEKLCPFIARDDNMHKHACLFLDPVDLII